MMHPSDERLLALAEKILRREQLSYREVLDVRHVGECDSCYELLQSMMAVIRVTDHVELALSDEKPEEAAVVQITILDTGAILRQLQELAGLWRFARPMDHAGVRGGESVADGPAILEDIRNSENCIVYDPEEKTLTIQLSVRPGEPEPKVSLRRADGTERQIGFQREEDMLFARITDLEDGEYRLIFCR